MAESIQHFALKTIGMSTVNGRKPCTLMEAARHNLREIQAELGASGHINPRRMADNVTLAGPAAAAQVQATAEGLLAAVDTSKLKRDHVQAIEVVFSLPLGAPVEPSAYFAKCVEWLRVAVPLPVLLAVVHSDESAPHAHVLLLPVKDGKHIGGALNTRPHLKQLRESFFNQVAGPAGLKRDGAKVRGMVKQWAIAAVLARCEVMGLPAVMGPLWADYRVSIERDPTPAMLALGIDVNALRPEQTRQASPIGLQSNPIGLAPRAIGLQKESEKHQALSCVGLHQQITPASAPKAAPDAAAEPAMPPPAIDTMVALWAAVGCRSMWTKPTAAERERLHKLAMGRAAERERKATEARQVQTERHSAKPERLQRATLAMQACTTRHDAPRHAASDTRHGQQSLQPHRVTDDGLTRERYEHTHDLSAWND